MVPCLVIFEDHFRIDISLLFSLLTHNWEVKLESFIGIRIDLTFVNAFVFVRDWLDNEEPVAGVDLMEHLEALVGDVDKLAHGN